MPKNDAVRAGESSSGNFVEGLWKDFRFALRSMRKNPVFVLFVVLTLALGIGANTTVFTLINTVVLNPLPVAESRSTGGAHCGRIAEHGEQRLPLPHLLCRPAGLSVPK